MRQLRIVPALIALLLALSADAAPQDSAPGVTAAGAARRVSRHLPPSPLTLAPPAVPAPLLSGVQATLRPACTYTGLRKLSYQLVQAPPGMTVDASSGVVAWTPPASAEGQQFAVTERVSDGTVTASAVFTVAVATTTPVSTSVSGSTVTVTQAGTLNGLAVTLPGTASLPAAQVKVAAITSGQAPPLPEGVTRVSDYFRVTPVSGGAGLITLALPTASVPAGRSPQDVRLFVYSEAAGNVGPDGDIVGPHWIRTWYAFDLLPSGLATIKLRAVGDLAFIGVEAPAAAPPAPAAATAYGTVQVGATAITIACTPFAFVNGLPAVGIQVCSVTGDVTMTVVVKQFSQLNANPAATLPDVLGWLAAARKEFTALGLGADASFEVVFEAMPEPAYLGFVTTENLEDRRVLHITNARWARPEIQGTVVHEYFHHAQSRTPTGGSTNLIDTNHRGDWLIEGTARWFEDHLFDSLDTYRTLEGSPIPAILEAGVAAPDRGSLSKDRSYLRFAFFKMVESACSGFSLSQVLGCNTAADPACLANFKSRLESVSWQCDFGPGFGEDNRATLANALLFYTYATMKEDDIGKLDSTEPYLAFTRLVSREQNLVSSAACTSFASCPEGEGVFRPLDQATLDPGAALTYYIGDVPALDPGQGAVVEVKSENGGELWAWVGNAERPGGLADGAWTKTTTAWRSLYAPSGRAPKTMVVLVNPDPAKDVGFQIRAGRAPTLAVYPDLPNQVWAPIFDWGCPEAEYLLTAVTHPEAPLPAHYRAVWDFGDGTPEVTVVDDPEVEHAWASPGQFPVLLRIHEMPANTLVAQANGTANIRYYAGRYRLDSFSGSASGTVGDPWAQASLAFVPQMLAHPEWALFDWNEFKTSRDAAFDLVPPGEDGSAWIIGFSKADTPGTADCPNSAAVNGDTYSGRFCAITGPTGCILCLGSSATQSGTDLAGSFGYWTKYLSCTNDQPPSCTTINEGQGTYTFTATYEK